MELLNEILKILQDEGVLEENEDDSRPVVSYLPPERLKETLDLSLNSTRNETELVDICRQIVKYSVKTGRPMFVNQLYSGVDKYGLCGAVLSEALNTNQYTYEVAPVFTLCELEVIKHSLALFGFQTGDGIFCPGGSLSNMYGVVLARYKFNNDIKRIGVSSFPPFVIYTSEDAHYSFRKGCHWLGIGTDNVVSIPTDERGRMRPDKLEEALARSVQQGKTPLAVCATAGSTVLGAFDELNAIAEVCGKWNVWMHVDACWGGTLAFSVEHKTNLNGAERADSISWNPHKMLGAPLQCSLFLVKYEGLLKECNMAGATYLFQPDKMYDASYDSGDKSVQCGRKVDGLKLWMMWKARGLTGFQTLVNRAMSLARYFLEAIKSRPGFKLVLPDFQCSNICFWFIPKRLRGHAETDEWWTEIHRVAPKLKKAIIEEGVLMIGYQPLDNKNFKNFFRLVVTCHPPRTEEDMIKIVKTLEEHGEGM